MSVIADGTNGPASGNVFGLVVLVIVMVPVTPTVLAGVGFNTGVIGETLTVASVSWPLSGTVLPTPPVGVTVRVAVLSPCNVVDCVMKLGLKTTLITQLSPVASVVPAQVLDAMLKLAVLHPPPAGIFVHVIVALPLPAANVTGTVPELITCTS